MPLGKCSEHGCLEAGISVPIWVEVERGEAVECLFEIDKAKSSHFIKQNWIVEKLEVEGKNSSPKRVLISAVVARTTVLCCGLARDEGPDGPPWKKILF